MPTSRTEAPQNHRVSIMYGDGAHSFWLAPGTTLGELAVHVSGLDTLHANTPLAINVVVETPRRPMPTIQPVPTSH